MGYVKITGEFTDRVRAVIRRMRDAAQDDLNVEDIIDGTPEHEKLLEIGMKNVWGEHLHLKDLMPERWRGESERIEFNFINGEGQKFHTAYITVAEDRGFPPGMSRWNTPTVRMRLDDEDTPAIIKGWLFRVQDMVAKKKEVSEKFKTIENQVVNFLRKHTSLNTAIKELPELEMYIDSSDMERLRRKVERGYTPPAPKEEADDEVGLDVELLTGTAVAHRIKNSR
jgi:hypothetical protein